MADVENGDVLRMSATWVMEEAYEITNVYHAVVTAGGSISYADAIPDVQEYMQDIADELTGPMSDHQHSDYLSLANETQKTVFGAIAWESFTVGLAADAQVPLAVCLFAWARTLKSRVQIRKYYGVFTEENLVDGAWSGTAETACQNAIDIHIAPWALGTFLTLQGIAYNRTLETYALPLAASTAAEPAYQRRRKRGRGS